MTENNDPQPGYLELPAEIAQVIGRIASDWAALEYTINQMIWELAGTAPALGACMTAQIPGLDGRLRALLSLMRLRQMDKALITKVNKFGEQAHGPTGVRNRAVHDPWYLRRDRSGFGRVQVTANKRLVFEALPIPMVELHAEHAKIKECARRLAQLADEIQAALPSLPEIPESALHPIKPVHRTAT